MVLHNQEELRLPGWKQQCNALVPSQFLTPYILITTCFALWGFAHDITSPMVSAFSTIFMISAAEGSLVQFAFYLGYGCMAIPAAIIIQHYSYKTGLLIGLGFFALGSLLFLPASVLSNFYAFLLAYFIMTCGLAFLETSANPFILSLGSKHSATQRLNLSQAFNPLGSLCGMVTAQRAILSRLDVSTAAERGELEPEELARVTAHDMAIVRGPYLAISAVVMVYFVVLSVISVPDQRSRQSRGSPQDDTQARDVDENPLLSRPAQGGRDRDRDRDIERSLSSDEEVHNIGAIELISQTPLSLRNIKTNPNNPMDEETDSHAGPAALLNDSGPTDREERSVEHSLSRPWNLEDLKRNAGVLFSHKPYRYGVLAQFCNIGAQIMCWTFVIHYGAIELNLTAEQAEGYNIYAMLMFCLARFGFTYVLTSWHVQPARLLLFLATGACCCTVGAICLPGFYGLTSLLCVSAFMSAMFPTIYGMALCHVDSETTKLGSAGLVMAIIGGSMMPVTQGALIDLDWVILSLSSVKISFVLPLLCFVGVGKYAFWTLYQSDYHAMVQVSQ